MDRNEAMAAFVAAGLAPAARALDLAPATLTRLVGGLAAQLAGRFRIVPAGSGPPSIRIVHPGARPPPIKGRALIDLATAICDWSFVELAPR